MSKLPRVQLDDWGATSRSTKTTAMVIVVLLATALAFAMVVWQLQSNVKQIQPTLPRATATTFKPPVARVAETEVPPVAEQEGSMDDNVDDGSDLDGTVTGGAATAVPLLPQRH